jgi:DNA segregation ATPase FtsK/SpoIIIE, S-DNA-T family
MSLWGYLKARRNLVAAFRSAGLYKTIGDDKKVFPKIHSVQLNKDQQSLTYIFTLLNGMDPKEIRKKEYVLNQHFGTNLVLEGDYKKFKLTIYAGGLKKKVNYSYIELEPKIKGMKVPIVCGKDLNGNWITYDTKSEPNALISGEPGSGKSTQLRNILVTLIQYKSHKDLNLYLGDLKMSEFHLFKNVEHVKGLAIFPNELERMLQYVYGEMLKRSQLLNDAGVMHIDDLPKYKKVPYILLAIDEIVMVMDNKNIKNMLVQIGSLGRALGIYVILSLQRPSYDILDTKIRSLLTVRMGFRTTDIQNAKIIGTPGSERISRETPGRFFLKRDKLTESQAPYLGEKEAKTILKRYKSTEWRNPFTARYGGSEKARTPGNSIEEDDIFSEV